jgi:hypothetical protein
VHVCMGGGRPGESARGGCKGAATAVMGTGCSSSSSSSKGWLQQECC